MPSSFFDAIDDLPKPAYLPNVTELLSASSYPHSSRTVPASVPSDDQMYGGIVATGISTDDDVEEGTEDIETRPKKRLRTNRSEQTKSIPNDREVPKRQRGRPKVSTRDDNAAERRRTQIRLAQRAYRNRKENTINELTEKVESLQATIKSVNTGFTRLRESLSNAGLVHVESPIFEQLDELLKQLSTATETMTSEAEKSSDPEDSEHQVEGGVGDPNQQGSKYGGSLPLAMQGQTHSINLQPVANFQSTLLDASMEYGMLDFDGQSLTDAQNYQVLPTSFPISSVSKIGPEPSLELRALSMDTQALASIERFPHKHTYTYSFQEKTFSRRLHRLCIERAFQRLLSPHVDPDWVLRAFRLTFNFTTKERIIQGFKNILARGTDEALENWRTPFIHVGGAGLHFPRRDATGQPVYPPNLLDPIRAAAPWRLANPETVPPADSLEDILKAVGFAGEWFDCHDVEEYLKTKGIHLEPQSSFVVVDSSLVNLPLPTESRVVSTLTSSSESSPQPHTSHAPAHIALLQGLSDSALEAGAFDQPQTRVDPLSALDNSVNDWLGDQAGLLQSGFDLEIPQSTFDIASRTTTLLTIEIEKFLERLSDQSVCLGRAPGFRREHVDHALALAMQEAF